MHKIAPDLYPRLTADKQPGKRPSLVLLMGISYSGKSTVAARFVEYDFVHFWATVIKHMYDIKDEKMLDVAHTVVKQLLQNGYKVVFDFTSPTIQYGNHLQTSKL